MLGTYFFDLPVTVLLDCSPIFFKYKNDFCEYVHNWKLRNQSTVIILLTQWQKYHQIPRNVWKMFLKQLICVTFFINIVYLIDNLNSPAKNIFKLYFLGWGMAGWKSFHALLIVSSSKQFTVLRWHVKIYFTDIQSIILALFANRTVHTKQCFSLLHS